MMVKKHLFIYSYNTLIISHILFTCDTFDRSSIKYLAWKMLTERHMFFIASSVIWFYFDEMPSSIYKSDTITLHL